ncbi:hypothetical protein JVU11DRAFT_8588 [Chiua virens]|nr:hypothetical protein JVU11DRAFT_8588 [Chiua virens]
MFSSVFDDDDKIPETPVSWFSRKKNYEFYRPRRTYDDSRSPPEVDPFTDLQHVITHIFFHPHIPLVFDDDIQTDLPLMRAICIAAHAYQDHIDCANKPQWLPIMLMLNRLKTVILSDQGMEFCLTKKDIISWFEGMTTGGMISRSL